MPWVRLDDSFTDHEKVAGLSDAAFRLHVSGLCWANRNLTDGFIDSNLIGRLGVPNPAKKAAQLVAAGLWDTTDGGWVIHDFLEFNPSKEKVEGDRRKARERMANRRSGSADVRANIDGSSVTPSRPDPTPTEVTSSSDSRLGAAGPVDDDEWFNQAAAAYADRKATQEQPKHPARWKRTVARNFLTEHAAELTHLHERFPDLPGPEAGRVIFGERGILGAYRSAA